MKKTIIFDFDGTIADSLKVMVEVYNTIAPKINTKIIESEKELNEYRIVTPQEAFKKLKITSWKLPVLLFLTKLKFNKRVTEVKPFEGIIEVIHALKKQGFQLGILTINSKKTIQTFLNKENIAEHFDFIYSSKQFYGKDKKLVKLMNQEKLLKEQVIYIGDESKDIEACHKVGIPIIAVSWGGHSVDLLAEFNPEYIAEEPSNIIEFLVNERKK